MKVEIKHFDHGKDLPLPEYATEDSAGVDLMAAVEENIILKPLERKLIPTGFAMELPKGYEAQVRPRSGLAIKHGITVLNSPGTIDADYRGEVCVILINLSHEDFTITRGMRIAQMIISPVTRADFVNSDELSETSRGQGGFGSTGLEKLKAAG